MATSPGTDGNQTTISLAGFHAVICETDNIEKEINEIKSKGNRRRKDRHHAMGDIRVAKRSGWEWIVFA